MLMGRTSEQAGLGSWRRENQQKAGGGGYWELLEIGPILPQKPGPGGPYPPVLAGTKGTFLGQPSAFPGRKRKKAPGTGPRAVRNHERRGSRLLGWVS